ncbi:MAG: AMP-binding protein [Burkholderiales bacterium]|nr:AMP-binding protein [Burkholderiales bacterium]
MTNLERFLAARDLLQAYSTDYERATREFAWPELTDFNWALDYFDAIAVGNDQPALRILEESGAEASLTYAELSTRSAQVANFLAGLGARKGDRMLLMLSNEIALWEAMLAAIKLGVVVIPATPLLSGADLADRLERGKVALILTNATGASKIDELSAAALAGIRRIHVGGARAGWTNYAGASAAATAFASTDRPRPADPLLEYFTSGTTSRPKLVRHTQASYPVGHLSTLYWLGLKKGDVHWTISSPGWAKHAWSCVFAPLNAQATIFIYNYTRFNGPAILDVLVKNGVTTLCAPPTVWRMLIQEDLTRWPVRLRELISAGEPLNPEVIEQVRAAWDITIRDGFGQTETTAMIGNSPGQALKPGSMGRPLPGYRIALLDVDGNPAEEGEISIDLKARPLSLMQGYAADDAKNAEVMRDGYYRTGDVGTRDAQGYITYVGRADDVFKASGYRISPFELESALIEHPAVAEAAVVPSPDPLRGFVPKAYVILAAGHAPDAATAADIFRFLRERVSGYKLVRRIEFSDLPKTISGKIRRVELRGQEKDRPATGPRNPSEFLEEASRPA